MRIPARSTLRHPVAVLAAGWALMLVAWAMANPPFAAPDEPAHYLRAIAVGEGSFGATPVVEAPPGLWARWPTPLGSNCNAGRRRISADCIDDYRRLQTSARVPTEAGGYPPPAYVLPGLALRLADDPASATRAARLAGAAVTLAFLVLAALLLFSARAQLLSLVGLVVAVTPLAIFVGASISNSGLEIGAGIAFAAALLRLTRSAERPRWVWAAAIVSAAALVSSRTTGVLWISLDLALGAALVWAARTTGSRDLRRPLAILAGVAVVGVAANRIWEGAYGWTLTQRGAVDYTGASGQIGHGLQQIRRLLDEQVGVFGWLDAPMPHAAYAAGQALLVALLTLAVLVSTRRERLVLAGTVAAYVAVGVVLSASLMAATGTDVQGRHVLAFSAVVPLLAGELLLRNRAELKDTSPRPIAAGLIVGTAVLQVVGFAASAYREAVGTDGPVMFVVTGDGWAPPLGWWPWSLVLLAGAALVASTPRLATMT